jgi:acetyl esterase/lipase
MRTRWVRAAALTVAMSLQATAGQPARPGLLQRQGQVPEGGRKLSDIEYARAGGKPILLDLYLPPKGEARPPLLVWIHGGGWRQGSKEHCPAAPFTKDGYAVASINYRLTDVAPFPAQIEDCKAAIRWLRAHAKEHGYDPDRIGVWGGSAGGHLVALLGTSGGVKELEGKEGDPDVSSRVQAVCDYFGPTDLTALGDTSQRMDRAGSAVGLLLGGTPSEHMDKARAASPITYISKDDPPFLIVHGDRDPLVPLHQSEILYEALKKAGVKATLDVVKGAGHGRGFGAPETRLVHDFFDRTLRGAATSPAPH